MPTLRSLFHYNKFILIRLLRLPSALAFLHLLGMFHSGSRSPPRLVPAILLMIVPGLLRPPMRLTLAPQGRMVPIPVDAIDLVRPRLMAQLGQRTADGHIDLCSSSELMLLAILSVTSLPS